MTILWNPDELLALWPMGSVVEDPTGHWTETLSVGWAHPPGLTAPCVLLVTHRDHQTVAVASVTPVNDGYRLDAVALI
jgi:hypothetical protein